MDKQRDDIGTSIGLLAVIYFIAAKLGLTLAYLHPNVAAIWPCSGIALAAFLIRGNGIWPAIMLGAFSASLTTDGSISTSLGIAIGNTLEAFVGAVLIRRYAHGPEVMDRAADVLTFAMLAGLLSTMISATFGVTSLVLGGFASWALAPAMWITWWLGAAGGVVLVTPLLLLWGSSPPLKWSRKKASEALALAAFVIASGVIVFGGVLTFGARNYPLEYVCMPFLIWAAFRFGRRGASVATLLLAATAIWGTLQGFGPFAGGARNASLLVLLMFLSVGAVMAMALAGEVTQRRRAERDARALAISDPMTGLGNYRRLIDALETEIKRSERMDRSFVFLLMDLDRLKEINDVHGHLAGDRALCRFANVLRSHCRNIDTAARYAGDEFAVILPETGLEAGRLVAERIAERLANDGEEPRASVSFGVALWPRDGRTTEALLHAADSAMYEMKRNRGVRVAAHR